MDFSSISFDAIWESDVAKAKELRSKAFIHGGIFLVSSICLLISIIRTICTNPGNIPDHKEWDMSTDQSGAEEEREEIKDSPTATGDRQQERFTNNTIERNLKDPKDI